MSDEKADSFNYESSNGDVPVLSNAPVEGIDGADPFGGEVLDPKEEWWAVLKMDAVLLPLMALFYFLSYVDKANIGASCAGCGLEPSGADD